MGEQTTPAPPHGHVLVVDDDLDILDAVCFVLESEGYRIGTAKTGAEALEQLRAGARPCLILLDLMMPVMNGWTFRALQLEDPALAALPVVVMTGLGGAAQIASLGVSDTLEKPVDLDKLLATVARYCQ